MASTSFEVTHYTIALGHALPATWYGVEVRARGQIVLQGDGLRLELYFLTDDSPVAPPAYDVDEGVAGLFLPFDQMAIFVDLLRNERPVFADLDSDSPERISLRTWLEPVGEMERG